MRINYTNSKTNYQLTESQVNEASCKLMVFCKMNGRSRQAKKLRKQLKKLEKAVIKGKFKK